ncbi:MULTISPECIES: hypothetical protein [Streptomyces]|uniref:Transposase n=1 Tax=Streptomyces siderophoricus TaxID=2802281 RepID=A0ABS1N2Z2_9ACTN|nr:hypothetical protein [Streptomyces sp. 9-7]MBL1094363.1 hypothetical protein [Streptomyces sp. 9-7]
MRAVDARPGALTVERWPGALKGDRRWKVVERFRQWEARILHLGAWAGAVGRVVKFRERGHADRGPLDVAIRFFGSN